MYIAAWLIRHASPFPSPFCETPPLHRHEVINNIIITDIGNTASALGDLSYIYPAPSRLAG